MKKIFLLASLLVLTGLGCINNNPYFSPSAYEQIKQNPEKENPGPEYKVSDWKNFEVQDLILTIPSDFTSSFFETKNLGLANYTLWPSDKKYPVTIDVSTSSKECVKDVCKTREELVTVNAKEWFGLIKSRTTPEWKTQLVKISGKEILIMTKEPTKYADSGAQVAFEYNNKIYIIDQVAAYNYMYQGKLLLLKIVETMKFKNQPISTIKDETTKSSTESRDATRILNLKQIQTYLELYYTDQNEYPKGSNIIVGSASAACLNASGWQPKDCSNAYKNEIPSDPVREQYYAYSVSNDRQNYRVTSKLEGSSTGYNGVITLTSAGITKK